MSKSEFRFCFPLFTFDQIDEILFWFRFRNRNSDSDFDFGISIPISEFRFRYMISMSKFQSIYHWNKSTFLFWLLYGILIPTIEIEIPITFDNFDQSIRIPIEIPTKLISVETLPTFAVAFFQRTANQAIAFFGDSRPCANLSNRY
jgi:hypothetical protein